jgi:hypothetical protein
MAQENPFAKYAPSGPLPSPPKVTDQNDEDRLALERERVRIAQQEADRSLTKDTTEQQAKTDKLTGAKQDAMAAIDTVLRKIDQVALDAADSAKLYTDAGFGETGRSGGFVRSLPGWISKGTAAYDLAQNIKTIDANTAFTALQRMRENSPTGGAVGNVSDTDMALLKSTITNLDPDQSQVQFFSNLAEAKRRYLEMAGRLDPEAPKKYENQPGIRFDQSGQAFLTRKPGPITKDEPIGTPFAGTGGNDGGNDPGGGGGNGGGSDGGGWSLGGALRRMAEGAGSIAEGAGNTIGFFGGNALGQTLYNATGYGDQTYDMGTTTRELLGLPKNPDRTNDTLIQGGTAALTGSLGARGVAGMMKPGAVRSGLEMFSAQPVRDTVAGVAAAGGSEVARNYGAGPIGQTVGGVIGGLTGYKGAGKVFDLMTPRVASAAADAAKRQGVNMLPADAGGKTVKVLTSGARISPISAEPIASAARSNIGDLSKAARRAAESQGQLSTTDVAGQAVQEGAKRYARDTRAVGGALYRKAWDDPVTSSLTIPARNSLAKVDEMIAALKESGENTNAGAISNLTKLRSDLANGMTAKAMHDLRSEIRDGVYDGGLRSGKEQGRMKALGKAMGDDMLGYLDATGNRRSADAIRKADSYYAQRVEQIDNVLEPIVGKDGKKGGEQVVQSLEAMARGSFGGNKRLAQLLKSMTPEEAGNVRAAIIDRIGKATPGGQSAEGSAFSASTFLTNWNRMTPQAKATLFSNKALRQNLDDIALLSEKMKATQQMANHSNTGTSIMGNVAVQGSWAVGNLPSYLLGMGAQFLTGKLLASPRFARMLAKVPQGGNPEAVSRKFTQELGVLAAQEPFVASDAKALQEHLRQSYMQSPVSAAAQEKEQD